MNESHAPHVDLTKAHGWLDLLYKWLYQQGVSTVLLFAITYGAWDGIPKWIAATRAGYAELHDGFSRDLKMVTEQMAKDQEKDRQLFERLLHEIRGTRKAIEESQEKPP